MNKILNKLKFKPKKEDRIFDTIWQPKFNLGETVYIVGLYDKPGWSMDAIIFNEKPFVVKTFINHMYLESFFNDYHGRPFQIHNIHKLKDNILTELEYIQYIREKQINKLINDEEYRN
jgi:hypothetical protein